MLSREVFGKGLNMLVVAFSCPDAINPEKAKDYKENREVWYSMVNDLSDSDFQNSVKYCVRNLKWFPKPAEIINGAPGSTENDSGLAWASLREICYDYSGKVDMLSRPIQMTVDKMGGLDYLKSLNWEAKEEWIRKEFEEKFSDTVISVQKNPHLLEREDNILLKG